MYIVKDSSNKDLHDEMNEWKYFIILFKQILIIINGLFGNINVWGNIHFNQRKDSIIYFGYLKLILWILRLNLVKYGFMHFLAQS